VHIRQRLQLPWRQFAVSKRNEQRTKASTKHPSIYASNAANKKPPLFGLKLQLQLGLELGLGLGLWDRAAPAISWSALAACLVLLL